jgi:hypothetical protein
MAGSQVAENCLKFGRRADEPSIMERSHRESTRDWTGLVQVLTSDETDHGRDVDGERPPAALRTTTGLAPRHAGRAGRLKY